MTATRDPMERYRRAQLVQLQVERLADEARTCTDVERLRAIRLEVSVCLESIRRIREDQLVEQLEPSQPRRPRWRFWR